MNSIPFNCIFLITIISFGKCYNEHKETNGVIGGDSMLIFRIIISIIGLIGGIVQLMQGDIISAIIFFAVAVIFFVYKDKNAEDK